MTPLATRGEIAFDAGDDSYVAKLGFNAMCALEERYDRPFLQIVTRIFPQLAPADLENEERVREAAMSVRMADLRAVLTAALADRHDLSEQRVGDVIDLVGPKRATALVAELVRAAVVEGDGDDASADPPKPRRKSGATGSA